MKDVIVSVRSVGYRIDSEVFFNKSVDKNSPSSEVAG